MILNLSVPDETYLKYGEFKAFHRPHMAMQETLKRFQDVDPGDARALVISGKERDELERVAGGVDIDSPATLLKVVKNAATLQLQGVEIPVPSDVLAFYLGNAEFQGRDPVEYIHQTLVEFLRKGAGK